MTQRNFGLDVLRCLAILIVLANHAFLAIFLPAGHGQWGGKATAVSLTAVVSIEWLFVLSGFLIGTMMIRSFEVGSGFWNRARSFWLRRWFRTMPNYYLFLLVNIVLLQMGLGMGPYSVKFAFFVQNFAWRSLPTFYNESWSLATDEWFYLVMPILVGIIALVRKLDLRTTFVLATVLLILAPTVARFLAEPPHAVALGDRIFDWDTRFRRVTVFHLDATGWGVLGAVTSRWMTGFWQRGVGAKAAAGLALMSLGIVMEEQLFFGGFFPDRWPHLTNASVLTLMGAGTFLALPWIAQMRQHGGPLGRGWAWVVDRGSTYSYSIYLVHFPLIYILRPALPPAESASLTRVWLQVIVWLAFTFAASAFIYHRFEKPTSDLRERYTQKVDARPFAATPTES